MNKDEHKYSRSVAILLVLALLSLCCARQGFPPGGPVDETPPELIAAFPEPNSVAVPTTTRVEFIFSEKMSRTSVEESLFITPTVGEKLKFKWAGKSLTIFFPGELRRDRTYIVTLGTDARDLRNNRLRDAFSLAFSTGAELDRGSIRGTVYSADNVEGVLIWAYDLSSRENPDPFVDETDYVTQCGAGGTYALSYLAPANYRVFAILDADKSRRYDPEYDGLGVAAGDIEIDAADPIFGNCNFQIIKRDTTAPHLDSAAPGDRLHLDLRFNEDMSPEGLESPANFEIVADSTADTLEILEAYHDQNNPGYVHLLTSEQSAGDLYEVRVKKGYDLAGLAIDSLSAAAVFKGSGIPDTLKPKIITYTPRDSSRGVSIAEGIAITFSEAMDEASVEKFFHCTDSSSHTIAGKVMWRTPASFAFHPDAPLEGKMRYIYSLAVDSVYDGSGNSLRDSSFAATFWTLNPDTLSALRGRFLDEDSTAFGDIFLRAQQVDPGDLSYSLTLEAPGPYAFENMLPGIYLLQGFRDADGDGRYSFGSPFPFIPSERFFFLSDSINVRSRWPNEGNDINLLKWKK